MGTVLTDSVIQQDSSLGQNASKSMLSQNKATNPFTQSPSQVFLGVKVVGLGLGVVGGWEVVWGLVVGGLTGLLVVVVVLCVVVRKLLFSSVLTGALVVRGGSSVVMFDFVRSINSSSGGGSSTKRSLVTQHC